MIRVLIADDEFIVRRAIRRIGLWEEFGMEVIGEADNGYAALDFILKNRPDVVILDMRMPGISGEDILEELKHREIKITIMVVSGFDSFEYARKALQYGVVDYILKPIDRNEFNKVLKKISGNFLKDNYHEKAEKNFCEQIREDIEREYQKDISLTWFSEKYFLNKDSLSRMYKKKYGVGITEYINQVRLEQAKVLLLLGYQISKVSEMVGYNDVNYFSRIFKKRFQISPSEFIRSEQGKSSSL